MPLALSAEQRESVEAALRPAKAQQRITKRASALLMLADGVAAMDVAKLLGVHQRTVRRWKTRFSCACPADALADAPRSGRPPSLSPTPTPPESKAKRVGRRRT